VTGRPRRPGWPGRPRRPSPPDRLPRSVPTAATEGRGLAPAADPDAVSVHLRRPALGPGEPVRALLLHGLGDSATVWEPFARHAPGRLELWCAELPWGGGGRWSRDEDSGRWVDDALRLATDAAGARPDLLIAHSFAATLALARLAAGAELAGAVVLVAPFYRASADEFDWPAISYYLNEFHQILAEGIRVRAGARLSDDLRTDMAVRVRDRLGPYGWSRFFDAYLRTPGLPLAGIDVPLLLVAGERDTAAFPRDTRALRDALAPTHPRVEAHVLPGLGHLPMVERPEQFSRLVDGFTASALAGPQQHARRRLHQHSRAAS